MSQEQDHYSVLGLKAKASAVEVPRLLFVCFVGQMTRTRHDRNPELCDRSNELTATCASSAPGLVNDSVKDTSLVRF